MQRTDSQEGLFDRLDALEARLDTVVFHHQALDELIRELTPVLRHVMATASGPLQDWESRGWLTQAQTLGGALPGLLAPDVVARLVEALDVLRTPHQTPPVGPLGLMRAASEPDVQQGLGVAVALLRILGRGPDGPTALAVRPPSAGMPSPHPPSPRPAAAPVTPPPSDPVQWEGRTFTPEGFLLDATTWDEDLARRMAQGLGIPLSEAHWEVVRWARADFAATGASPNVRRVAVGSGVGTRRLYELFPQTPGKTLARIAGLPKPVGCV